MAGARVEESRAPTDEVRGVVASLPSSKIPVSSRVVIVGHSLNAAPLD